MSREINKKLTVSLIMGIIFSIGFPVGIILIVFHNKVSGIGSTLLLVLGIILVVLGFYGAPMVWIMYGETKSKKRICQQITLDNNQEIKYLAEINNIPTENMLKKVQELINQRLLTGYEIVDNKFVVPKGKNTLSKDEALELSGKLETVTCKGCGAEIEIVGGKKTYCKYCGKLVNR